MPHNRVKCMRVYKKRMTNNTIMNNYTNFHFSVSHDYRTYSLDGAVCLMKINSE